MIDHSELESKLARVLGESFWHIKLETRYGDRDYRSFKNTQILVKAVEEQLVVEAAKIGFIFEVLAMLDEVHRRNSEGARKIEFTVSFTELEELYGDDLYELLGDLADMNEIEKRLKLILPDYKKALLQSLLNSFQPTK